MVNRLTHENSPYLLQHIDNPVDWYPWGEEALQKARQEDKPIFLSIGYAACHWCHVMAHESFEDPNIAAIMNEHFVNIKVDREERPDLDSIYMNAVVALTGQGGWPMSVFLTPDGKPFYGGTYFPPVRRYNMPSFVEVLHSVARAWQDNRDQLLKSSDEITSHIQSEIKLGQAGEGISEELLQQASLNLAQTYDWIHGGWGSAPKFPQPMAIEFLLRKAAQGDKFALEIAYHALRAMAKGGMYDVVGGGFARYSVDDRWLVPHFEKMLYDNAQLAKVYLYGYLLTGDLSLRKVCEATLDFIIRELRHPEGGFFSSLDADSEGEEGKFYVWTSKEIRQALGNQEDEEFITAAYNVTDGGNFEGKTVLQRALDDKDLASRFEISEEEVAERFERIHEQLRIVRSARMRPGTDDKVLTSWNGMMLTAFAEAARYLKRPDYLKIAIENANFLLNVLHPEDRLLRSWRNGIARHNAYLEDYASLILGLLALYQTDSNPRWYQAATDLGENMLYHYQDPEGGFFDTRDDHEPLLTRPKDLQDNATPSGNAMAALGLIQLSALKGSQPWSEIAEKMMGVIQQATARYPTSFAKWLIGLDLAHSGVQEVAILGNPEDDRTADLVKALWSKFRPRVVAAISNYPAPEKSPPLLEGRALKDNSPTAYVCQNFVCLQPVNRSEDLIRQLENDG
jgi:uncharacterized protein